jgi:hypothetical protein
MTGNRGMHFRSGWPALGRQELVAAAIKSGSVPPMRESDDATGDSW